jgi:sugar lactone lactonase YvrE
MTTSLTLRVGRFLTVAFPFIATAAIVLKASSAHAQNLFVAEFYTGNIYEFTPNGTRSTFASGLRYPSALAFNKAGDLFVCELVSGNIYEFTPNGTRSTFASGLYNPSGLAFDKAGDLFVTSYVFTGGPITEIATNGVKSTFGVGLDYSTQLAFDRAGNLFVGTDTGTYPSNNIYEFTPGGTQSIFATSYYGVIGGPAFNSAGVLFVDNWNDSIIEFATNGLASTFANVNEPIMLAFDGADNLFVTSIGNGNITEITTNGVERIFASGLNSPQGLTFQPSPELQAVVTGSIFQVTVSMPPPCYSTIIQFSTNLVNWVSIYTNTPPYTFTNSMATTPAQCFYRGILGP